MCAAAGDPAAATSCCLNVRASARYPRGMFWELRQQQLIREAEAQALEARADARDVRGELKVLEGAIERLLLVNRAMWEMFSGPAGLTEKDLIAKVREIDLRDGREDGRLRLAVRDCVACGRTMQKKHARCLYCGAEEQGADPFRAV